MAALRHRQDNKGGAFMWQQFFFWAEAGHGRTLRDHREDEDDSRVKEEISTGPPFLERTRSPKLLLTPPPPHV